MALVEVKWLKLDPEAKLPTKGTDKSAGYDFYSLESVELKPKQTKVIKTGLSWEPYVSIKDKVKRHKELENHGNNYPLIRDQMTLLAELNEELYSFYENNFLVRMEMSSRSSLFSKNGIVVSGKIDEDYRGPIGIMIQNNSMQSFKINKGDRIAQGEIGLVPLVEMKEVKKLNPSSRGESGFGSTGK